MERFHVKQSLALAALTTLAACAGGGGWVNGSSAIPPHNVRAASLLTNIVGVGDSLTAGYQADGILGQTGVKNPLPYTPGTIPPNQENGWWALLVEQATSTGSGSSLDNAIATMYDPSKSPLPLIKGPGLDNQIIPNNNIFEPFAQFKGSNSCTFDGGFNQSGFGMRSSARVRLDPNSAAIRDFGVPGLTLHEANWIHQPQTDTCSPLPGIPGLLSDVVNEESGTFWPVLRNFSSLGGHLTEVNAAASVHPTLATVWLGANDVLKYMGSGGRFVGGDRSPGQAESDLRATISTLQHAGAKIVLANLPNILETGYFQRVTNGPVSAKDCQIKSYAYCLLVDFGGLPSNVVQVLGRKYQLSTPNGCSATSTTTPCGYLTLAGAIAVLQNYLAFPSAPYVSLDCAVPAPNCKVVPGSGLGANYITPEFAGKVQARNNAINQGIDDAASATHVPLVDIASIFHGLASGKNSNSWFQLASSIAPGVCCTLGFVHPTASGNAQGGILSFDGIHPSNSGYALLAYAFIDTINKAYGTSIPQVDLQAAYGGTRCGNSKYCFPDPYAPH